VLGRLVGSRGEHPLLKNCSSRRTVLMAGKRSRAAFDFTTKPSAPMFIASCDSSGRSYDVKKRILERGAMVRIRRAASRPLRFGRQMSSKIKSGCNSWLFCTASKPSELSQMTTRSRCCCRSEQTDCRQRQESSTTKIHSGTNFGILS